MGIDVRHKKNRVACLESASFVTYSSSCMRQQAAAAADGDGEEIMESSRTETEATTPAWGAYLTYAQAERYSGLSRSTLWRLLKRGEIAAVKAGSAVRIVRTSLDEYLEAHAWLPPEDEEEDV